MGNKIFVSYKYADSHVKSLGVNTTVRNYVDVIVEHFKNNGDHIYKGELDGEDLSHLTDDQIWEKIKPKIHDSTITIVLISPNMKEAFNHDKNQWIPWEISYSLKEIERNDKTSHSNAILAVVLPDVNNEYKYFIEDKNCIEDCKCNLLKTDTLFKILKDNMFNQKEKTERICATGSKVYQGYPSYIKSIKWDDFIINPQTYLDTANLIKNDIDKYNITKEV